MLLDVTELLREVGAEARVRGEEKLKFDKEEIDLSGPIKYNLKLLHTGLSVIVKGSLEAKVKLSCVRCLKDTLKTVKARVEEEFSKNSPAYKKIGGEIELGDKDFVYEISPDNQIDIGEMIRQNLIMALPMKPICHSACRIKTESRKKEIDPRLAKLKEVYLKRDS
jgi:uncharacterized protein